MAAPTREGAGDRDDWFADVEQQAALERDPPSAEDDWLVPSQPARVAAELPWRRIAIFGAFAVVALVAILGAAGVFSSGSSKPRAITPPPVTVPAQTTTPATTKPKAAALPKTTLKPGDTGAQVKALQRSLKSLGYPVGKVDGQYGPATKTAVASFQHAEGLTEDGVFGPKTLDALIHRAGP
jgi:Putative peptidoglycan binding domain